MKKKFIFKIVMADLTRVTLTFDLVTPILIVILCYPRWMFGTSLRKVDHGVLELLIGNGLDTFDPGDPDL